MSRYFFSVIIFIAVAMVVGGCASSVPTISVSKKQIKFKNLDKIEGFDQTLPVCVADSVYLDGPPPADTVKTLTPNKLHTAYTLLGGKENLPKEIFQQKDGVYKWAAEIIPKDSKGKKFTFKMLDVKKVKPKMKPESDQDTGQDPTAGDELDSVKADPSPPSLPPQTFVIILNGAPITIQIIDGKAVIDQDGMAKLKPIRKADRKNYPDGYIPIPVSSIATYDYKLLNDLISFGAIGVDKDGRLQQTVIVSPAYLKKNSPGLYDLFKHKVKYWGVDQAPKAETKKKPEVKTKDKVKSQVKTEKSDKKADKSTEIEQKLEDDNGGI